MNEEQELGLWPFEGSTLDFGLSLYAVCHSFAMVAWVREVGTPEGLLPRASGCACVRAII